MRNAEVWVCAQGVEVAKWLQQCAVPPPTGVGASSLVAGVRVVSVMDGAGRELGLDADPSPSLLRGMLDRDAYIELVVGPPILDAGSLLLDTVTLAATAMVRADEALSGLLGRCEKIIVRVMR